MYKVMGRNVILLNYNGALFKNAVCIGRVIDRFLPNWSEIKDLLIRYLKICTKMVPTFIMISTY